MRRRHRPTKAARCLALFGLLTVGNAQALDCGTFNFPSCSKAITDPAQYAGGFVPPAPFGGFGGGNDCKGNITHTPVVLVHGNGDSAIGWDSPAPARADKPEGRSVYDELKARGYSDCEVFGVSYLDKEEQGFYQTARNFHEPKKYEIVWRFIESVKAYTGSQKVDIVGHSFGASMTLAALDYYSDAKFGKDEKAWASVRRFINIAGGIRGLNMCWGMSNLLASTCQAEQSGHPDAFYEFGFYPDLPWWWGWKNRWTSGQGEHSMRQAPLRHPGVDFYSILAGQQDDIHCPQSLAWVPTPVKPVKCDSGPLFEPANNVRSQLNIGADPAKPLPSWVEQVDQGFRSLVPRDLGGIGHFGARNYAGPIIAQMLTSDCRGAACKGTYAGKLQLSKP